MEQVSILNTNEYTITLEVFIKHISEICAKYDITELPAIFAIGPLQEPAAWVDEENSNHADPTELFQLGYPSSAKYESPIKAAIKFTLDDLTGGEADKNFSFLVALVIFNQGTGVRFDMSKVEYENMILRIREVKKGRADFLEGMLEFFSGISAFKDSECHQKIFFPPEQFINKFKFLQVTGSNLKQMFMDYFPQLLGISIINPFFSGSDAATKFRYHCLDCDGVINMDTCYTCPSSDNYLTFFKGLESTFVSKNENLISLISGRKEEDSSMQDVISIFTNRFSVFKDFSLFYSSSRNNGDLFFPSILFYTFLSKKLDMPLDIRLAGSYLNAWQEKPFINEMISISGVLSIFITISDQSQIFRKPVWEDRGKINLMTNLCNTHSPHGDIINYKVLVFTLQFLRFLNNGIAINEINIYDDTNEIILSNYIFLCRLQNYIKPAVILHALQNARGSGSYQELNVFKNSISSRAMDLRQYNEYEIFQKNWNNGKLFVNESEGPLIRSKQSISQTHEVLRRIFLLTKELDSSFDSNLNKIISAFSNLTKLKILPQQFQISPQCIPIMPQQIQSTQLLHQQDVFAAPSVQEQLQIPETITQVDIKNGIIRKILATGRPIYIDFDSVLGYCAMLRFNRIDQWESFQTYNQFNLLVRIITLDYNQTNQKVSWNYGPCFLNGELIELMAEKKSQCKIQILTRNPNLILSKFYKIDQNESRSFISENPDRVKYMLGERKISMPPLYVDTDQKEEVCFMNQIFLLRNISVLLHKYGKGKAEAKEGYSRQFVFSRKKNLIGCEVKDIQNAFLKNFIDLHEDLPRCVLVSVKLNEKTSKHVFISEVFIDTLKDVDNIEYQNWYMYLKKSEFLREFKNQIFANLASIFFNTKPIIALMCAAVWNKKVIMLDDQEKNIKDFKDLQISAIKYKVCDNTTAQQNVFELERINNDFFEQIPSQGGVSLIKSIKGRPDEIYLLYLQLLGALTNGYTLKYSWIIEVDAFLSKIELSLFSEVNIGNQTKLYATHISDQNSVNLVNEFIDKIKKNPEFEIEFALQKLMKIFTACQESYNKYSLHKDLLGYPLFRVVCGRLNFMQIVYNEICSIHKEKICQPEYSKDEIYDTYVETNNKETQELMELEKPVSDLLLDQSLSYMEKCFLARLKIFLEGSSLSGFSDEDFIGIYIEDFYKFINTDLLEKGWYKTLEGETLKYYLHYLNIWLDNYSYQIKNQDIPKEQTYNEEQTYKDLDGGKKENLWKEIKVAMSAEPLQRVEKYNEIFKNNEDILNYLKFSVENKKIIFPKSKTSSFLNAIDQYQKKKEEVRQFELMNEEKENLKRKVENLQNIDKQQMEKCKRLKEIMTHQNQQIQQITMLKEEKLNSMQLQINEIVMEIEGYMVRHLNDVNTNLPQSIENWSSTLDNDKILIRDVILNLNSKQTLVESKIETAQTLQQNLQKEIDQQNVIMQQQQEIYRQNEELNDLQEEQDPQKMENQILPGKELQSDLIGQLGEEDQWEIVNLSNNGQENIDIQQEIIQNRKSAIILYQIFLIVKTISTLMLIFLYFPAKSLNIFNIVLPSDLLQWVLIGFLISILIDEAINIICYIKSFFNENLTRINKFNLSLNILFSCVRIYIAAGILGHILNFNLPFLNFNMPVLLFFLTSLHLLKTIANEIDLCRKGKVWQKSLLPLASATSLLLLPLNVVFNFYPSNIFSVVLVAVSTITVICNLVFLLIEKQKVKNEINVDQKSCFFSEEKSGNCARNLIPVYQN